MWEKDIHETRERYQQRWHQYGFDCRTLGWDKDCQWVRFEAIFEGVGSQEYGSILDLGCGFGDLLGYLRLRGWTGHYTGVDLVPELIQEAQARHRSDEKATFECRDIEAHPLEGRSDMAVAIGVFNHRLQQDNRAFVAAMLNHMWQSSTRLVVCDFLSTASQPERRKENLYYADPREMYDLACNYSRRIAIHHAYMPFEFQVKIWHDDGFSGPTPVFSSYAHLARAQTEQRKVIL